MTTASSFAPCASPASDPPAVDVSVADVPADVPAADAVHLDGRQPLVPAELLAPPFREENRGLLRDLAAILLDRHLRRLARMRNPVDLHIGRILSRLDRASGWVALGFARLGDYAAERLGLPARRARALLVMARGLEPLPRLAAAFEAGDLSRSQVALLLRVATPDNETSWLARARRLNVRLLERDVRASLAADHGGTDAAAGASTDQDSTGQPTALDTIDDDDASPGEWVDLPIPGRLRPLWDRVLELARRVSGSPEPVSDCVEMIAADFLAGVPDIAMLAAGEDGIGGQAVSSSPDGDTGDDRAPRGDGTDLFEG